MPSSRLVELAEHRAQLIAKSDAQRGQLIAYHRRFATPFRLAESIISFGNTLRHSPLLVAGLTAVLTRTPWRKLGHVPRLAWRGWKIYRFVRSWIA